MEKKVHYQCSVSFNVVSFETCVHNLRISIGFLFFFVAGAHKTSLLWILLALCWGDELWKVATRETIRSCRGRGLSSRCGK